MKPTPRTKSQTKKSSRNKLPTGTEIWEAMEHETGMVFGFLIMRDHLPIGFVRGRSSAYAFDVAKQIAREPSVMKKRQVAGLQVDDLRRARMIGIYVDLPVFMFSAYFQRADVEQSDLAQFSLINRYGERECCFNQIQYVDRDSAPGWLRNNKRAFIQMPRTTRQKKAA